MNNIHLSVIIPAYNEERRIGRTLLSLAHYFEDKTYGYEIIVVDDGSRDKTSEVVAGYQSTMPNLRLIRNSANSGKGYAVKTGILSAKGEYRLFMDADNSVTIDAIEAFWPEMEKENMHIVIGSIALQESHYIEHTGWHRKVLRFISKKIIHTFLSLGVRDTQRGFKLFTKRAAETIFTKSTINGFLFDVELLVIARNNNFRIKELPVDWDNPAGSKINLMSYGSSLAEFGKIISRKLQGKYRAQDFFEVHRLDPEVEERKGKGFLYKNNEFIHHSDLHHTQTALYNLLYSQKVFILSIIGILLACLVINWHTTIVVVIATLTILYFLDLLFNAFLIYRSFSKNPEISISTRTLQSLTDESLPIYTIFCPLYKEWQVVPQFVQAMQALDYPKEKLQVMLLLEENDSETIEKVREHNLPSHFEVVIVPHSSPKTKPKAMNYGLQFVKGEYLVIYDAEDVPDPLQLKKAIAAFKKVRKNIVCIQAKLNFYNPHQNLLTRVFTAEYSLWFDLVLPGLQSVQAPIPLGGTSNHFKVHILKELSGWDAFNVTEDADLGMRLAKEGYRTAILDSTTHEEANSGMHNWYNQRSRWIKGYIQTYFVHTRDQQKFIERGAIRDMIIFHLNVGGKILSMFINPFMWLLTATYFLFRATAGPMIESFFPDPILYIGVFSLVFGNFLYMYYYMIGCAKRGYYDLIKYAFVVPFYWIGMSIAAWKALYEVVVKPHYWSKTVHGLHLEKQQPETMEELQINDEEIPEHFWVRFKRSALSGAGILVAATLVANFINLTFNIYLGSRLSLEEFGVVTALNTLVYLIGIAISAYGTTIVHQVAGFSARFGNMTAYRFYQRVRTMGIIAAAVVAIGWAFLTPVIASFLHIENQALVFSFAPAIIAVILGTINRGYLQGSFLFTALGGIIVSEVLLKLALAVGLVKTGNTAVAALALPCSMVGAYLISLVVIQRPKKDHAVIVAERQRFSFKFFSAALLTGFSTNAFLSLDVFLAKHYLNAASAGTYSLLSLTGKMIFFFGSLLNVFIIPMISRAESEGGKSKQIFSRIFIGAFTCAAVSSLSLIILGPYILPHIFGSHILTTFEYLRTYALAMFLLAITNAIVLFRLARKEYLFSIVAVVAAIGMVMGIVYHHADIQAIVHVLLVANACYAAAIIGAHFLYSSLRSFLKNLQDIGRVVFPVPKAMVPQAGKKRILVFNWRCLQHAYAGGAEVYIQTLARQWVKDGHSVTIFCGSDHKSSANEYVDGIRIIRRGGFFTVYLCAVLYYLAKFRGKFDVIVDCENGIPFFTPLYAKEPVYCLVHHVHQDVFRKYLPAPLAAFAGFLERKVMPWAYRSADFITVSNSSKQDMEALSITDKHIEVIHPGVDLSFLQPAEKHKIPLIAYVGRLKEYKSIDVLIRAFARVLGQVSDARLVIAGTGENRKTLENLVAQLNIQNSVDFVGKVSEEEKRAIFQQAWVCVNPSMVEGWGITTIEANACGTPVLASDVPGLRDSVRDGITGFLFPHGDSVILANKILSVIRDGELHDKLSIGAIKWSKEFAWEKSAEKFLRIII